jgi:hypothetical protein
MVASPVPSALPVATTATNKMPVMAPPASRNSHAASIQYTLSEKNTFALRRLNTSRDSRVAFKNIQNLSLHSLRPPGRLTMSRPPAKQTPPKLGTYVPPTSDTASRPQISPCSVPAALPLVIAKIREDVPKSGIINSRRHVRFRHRMAPAGGMPLPVIPPFRASSMKKLRRPALMLDPCSQSLPSSSSLVDTESFDQLKESIFSDYYRPSASSDSLATIQRVSDDQGQIYGEPQRIDYRRMQPSSRCAGVTISALQATRIRSAIFTQPAVVLPVEQTSTPPNPPLMASAIYRFPVTQMSTQLAGGSKEKDQPTSILTRGENIGFPMDMLDILSGLETLAGKVKTLEVPRGVKPKCGEQRLGLPRQIIEEGINGRNKAVGSAWNKLEKGKWRVTEPDVRDHPNQVSEISVVILFPPYLTALNINYIT